MSNAIPLSILLCMVGCSSPQSEVEPDGANAHETAEEPDDDTPRDAEIVETLDSDGRILTVEAFAGTVDAYLRSFRYDESGRLVDVTTETALGASQQAYPIWDDDGLIVAVQRVFRDAEGVEQHERTVLDAPCRAPYRCMDEC